MPRRKPKDPVTLQRELISERGGSQAGYIIRRAKNGTGDRETAIRIYQDDTALLAQYLKEVK